MIDGLLCVNKPKGYTSHDVVQRVRRLLGTKKIGHAGTLDPDATGLLILAIGRATKLIQYLQEVPKTYIAEWTGGISTDTEDASGRVLERVEGLHLDLQEVKEAFASFIGSYEQVPPMYSAVKVKGKRLYEIAREGESIAREPRRVTIYDLSIIEPHLDQDPPRILFEVTCSKGTYIRTLCTDIGKKLGVPSHMSSLIRMKNGGFHLSDSHTLEELEDAARRGEIERWLIPMEEALPFYPKVTLDEAWKRRVLHGGALTRQFPHQNWREGERIRLFSQEGLLLAIYRVTSGEEIIARPETMLRTEDKVG